MTGLSGIARSRLLGWFAIYVLLFWALAAWRWHIWSYGADLGTFAQAIAHVPQGFTDENERGTHFRFHWSPVLALLWPLVALARSPLPLQWIQAALCGAVVFPLYGIARGYVNEARAATYALLALLYPPLLGVGFLEFHEVAFLPVTVLALFWAAERARWGWFAAFAVLSATIREDACMTLAVAGVVLCAAAILAPSSAPMGLFAGTPHEPRNLAFAGAGLAVVNVIALALYFGIVIPHLGTWAPSHFYAYSFSSGPLSLVLALLAHPAYLGSFVHFGRLTYLLEAFGPLAFLPLFSRWTLLALPALFMLLLSNESIAWRMGNHYAALWIPWLLAAALAVLVRLEITGAGRRAFRWMQMAFACSLIVLIGSNPLHPAHYLTLSIPNGGAAELLERIPAGEHVVTHDEWFTHLALRNPRLGAFFCADDAYALYDRRFPNQHFQARIEPELRRALAAGEANLVARAGVAELNRLRQYRANGIGIEPRRVDC